MLNHFTIQGRLIADPELRTTQSGTSVCSFRVAWSEKYKDTETKLFIGCSAWRGTGEMIAKYFSKGKEILLEGKLSTRDWKDKEGNDRQSIELTVERAHFCGPKQGEGSNSAGDGGYHAAGAPVNVGFSDIDEEDGELPF